MAGLLDSLTATARSLSTARLGLEVAGHNLANVNTEGYSRRTLVLAEIPPIEHPGAGRGVEVMAVQAHRDELVLARLWNEQQRFQFGQAMTDGLREVEGAVGLAGQSLDASLGAFFDGFQTLADDPTSVTGRDNAVRQGQQLAIAFREMSARFLDARRGADTSLVAAVDEVNGLARRVAELNEGIAAGGPDVESLRDARDEAIGRLRQLADVGVTRNTDGSVSLSIGSGRTLVVGRFSYAVETEGTPPLGLTALSTGGFDVTNEIEGGRIGGLVHLRDAVMPAYSDNLDQLAFDLVSVINTAHQAGFDANGAGGGVYFTPLGSPTGAAAAMDVDAAIAADSNLVAASGTGALGDNATARALAAMRDDKFANGGTATAIEAWGLLAYRIGSDLAAVKSANTAGEQVMQQLEQLRAQVSGVSVDEEAANLVRFQRAYEANARYFTTINDLLDTLMGMVQP
jgi:flagellar hook-associated protein 1 FlgK